MDRRNFLRTGISGVAVGMPSQSLLAACRNGVILSAGGGSPEQRDLQQDYWTNMVRFESLWRPVGISWPLRLNDVNALYDTYVRGLQGAVRYEDVQTKPQGAGWLAWNGDGTVGWNVSSPKAEYEVNLCYASSVSGAPVTVSVRDQSLKDTIRLTNGYWPDDSKAPMNFERVPLEGKLQLPQGENSLLLRTSGSRGTIRLRSLELVPVAAKDGLRQDAELARASRASTDWFVRAGYGLFIHWTPQVPPLRGKRKPYAEAVRDFNVPAFAKLVQDTGAGYLIFTATHAEPSFPAPIKSWENYWPGWTTERDLIAEMADELDKRGIRLIVYMASEIVAGVRARHVSTPELQKTLEDLWTEIGNRYGDKVAGYWFDHCSWSYENYPNFSLQRLWRAVKAGNPQRLVAYNFWQYPVMTAWQDYWANEAAIQRPPDGRYTTVGPAKGLQFHASVPIDGAYMNVKPDSDLPAPIYKDEQVVDFVKACVENQGVVTLGAAISQDLQMNEAILRQLRLVRKAVRGVN